MVSSLRISMQKLRVIQLNFGKPATSNSVKKTVKNVVAEMRNLFSEILGRKSKLPLKFKNKPHTSEAINSWWSRSTLPIGTRHLVPANPPLNTLRIPSLISLTLDFSSTLVEKLSKIFAPVKFEFQRENNTGSNGVERTPSTNYFGSLLPQLLRDAHRIFQVLDSSKQGFHSRK